MIDRNDPEIQAYLKEELQRQAEQITERLLFKYIDSERMPEIEEIEYFTGVSTDKIKKIENKCAWKVKFKRDYEHGSIIGKVKVYYDLFKEKAIDIEKMAAVYHIELSQLEEYVKNPEKYAVFELVSHGITGRDIMKTIGITKGELQRYLLSWYTSNAYKPKLQFSEPKDEDLEEAYLEAVGAKECCDGKTDW